MSEMLCPHCKSSLTLKEAVVPAGMAKLPQRIVGRAMAEVTKYHG